MKHLLLSWILALAVLFIPTRGFGQAVYSWTNIGYDESTNTVIAEASISADYDVAYYYQPTMLISLYSNNQVVAESVFDPAMNAAVVSTSAQLGIDYFAVATPYLMLYFGGMGCYSDLQCSAWFYYNQYYPGITDWAWYDPFGFFNWGASCGGYDAMSCYGYGPAMWVNAYVPWPGIPRPSLPTMPVYTPEFFMTKTVFHGPTTDTLMMDGIHHICFYIGTACTNSTEGACCLHFLDFYNVSFCPEYMTAYYWAWKYPTYVHCSEAFTYAVANGPGECGP